jgi:hypothetical protein
MREHMRALGMAKDRLHRQWWVTPPTKINGILTTTILTVGSPPR